MTRRPQLPGVVVFLLPLLASLSTAHAADVVDVISVRPLGVRPGELVDAIHLAFSSGSIEALHGIPAAWTIIINNNVEAGVTAKVDGTTQFGSEALNPAAFAKLSFLVLEAPYDGSKLAAEGSVELTADFEKFRTVKLTPADFIIKPRRREGAKADQD